MKFNDTAIVITLLDNVEQQFQLSEYCHLEIENGNVIAVSPSGRKFQFTATEIQ